MKMRLKTSFAALCAGLLFICACTYVPITGRKQLNIVPDSLLNSMSVQQYGEFISQSTLSSDPVGTAAVRNVGARISAAVERWAVQNDMAGEVRGYQWEFNLIEDSAKNAWAMPGGKVVVYTGILPITGNDAGLATVMGHEIAHVIARHGNERMSQGLLVEMGGMALSTAISQKPSQTQDLFMRVYGVSTQVGVMLPYSRVQETEADRLGLIFMAMAGYDPHEAVAFWQRMNAASERQAPPEFLSTHPAGQRRISNLQSFIPEAMRYYQR